MKTDRRILTSYIIVVLVYLIAIPLIVVTAGRALNRLAGLGSLLPSPYRMAAGCLALAYGWFWILWSQIFLIRRGKGHPNEILGRELAPTTRSIVTEGPYRHTRNPMAYGLIIFYFLSLAILSDAPFILFFFPAACIFEIRYHKKYEEPGLLTRFGEDYENYRKRVPLLFPFMKKTS